MRPIFLNRFFHPDHSATSQILSDLAFSLAEEGREVRVITSRQRYDDARAQLPARETVRGVEVHRIATTRFGRGRLLVRAVDYLTFYLSATWQLWRLARKGDVIVAKTDPPLLSIPVAIVARLRGARLVNWLQDAFPEVAEAAGVGGRAARPLLGLLRALRNRSLRAAAMNVALGDRMAAHLREEGVAEAQIRVIPNWQDGHLVRPVPHKANRLRTAWGLEGKFVVGYSGNLGRVHDLATLLEAMALLHDGRGASGETKDAEPEIVFLFIGGGALHAMLAKEVEQRGLSNVLLKPYQPREALAESLSVADVHLVTLRPEFEGLIVPSKFYGVAAAGRATIFVGDLDGEIPRLLAEHDCGLTVEPGDGEALASRIRALAQDPGRCEAMGRRARALLDQRFEKAIAVCAWSAMLDEVSGKAMASARSRPEVTPGG